MSNEERAHRQIVSKTSTQAKPKGFKKFVSYFLPKEAEDPGEYIVQSIIIPAAKKTVSDIVDTLIWGGKRNTGRTSYRSYYDNPGRASYNNYNQPATNRNAYEYANVIIADRGEAEEVLDELNADINRYGCVRVADLNEMLGITTDVSNYTENNYGWKSIEGARVIRTTDGFMLKLPRPIALR